MILDDAGVQLYRHLTAERLCCWSVATRVGRCDAPNSAPVLGLGHPHRRAVVGGHGRVGGADGPPDQRLGRLVAGGARRRISRTRAVNSALGLEVVPVAAFLIRADRIRPAARSPASPSGYWPACSVLDPAGPRSSSSPSCTWPPRPLRRRFWVVPLTAAAVVLPWCAFSWYHFGPRDADHARDQDAAAVVRRRQPSPTGSGRCGKLGATLPPALALVPAAIGLRDRAGACWRRAPPPPATVRQSWPLAGLGLGGIADFGAHCLLGRPPVPLVLRQSPTVAPGRDRAGLARSRNRCSAGRVAELQPRGAARRSRRHRGRCSPPALSCRSAGLA